MKSKAKPVKGSARVQKFDRGGTIGALAGLGTLAYLMRDKFGKGKDKAGAGDANLGSGESTAKPKVKGFDAEKAAEIAQISGGNPENEPGKGGRAGIITPEPGRDLSLKGETDEQRKANIFGKYKPQERIVTAPVAAGDAEPVEPVKKAKAAAKPVAKAAAKPAAKTAARPAKASDKVGKGYEKLDSRDTGYSGVTKQEGSQSFGGEASKPTGGTKSKKTPIKTVESDKRPSKPYPKKAGEVTYLTKERSDKAKKAYYGGFKRDNTLTAAEKAKEAKNKKDYDKESMGTAMGLKRGGSVSSASRRADGIAQRGKTRA
jgi:hypothetical protein